MNDIIAGVLIVFGCLLCLIAAVGMIRLPDTLIRMHAATKAGTLGTGFILAGVAVFFAETGTILKASMGLIFLLLTAPVAAHLIGRAAYRSGIELSSATKVDHLGDDMKTESRMKKTNFDETNGHLIKGKWAINGE
jgi:multicomponent Na+:H+ antiporter subunit G